MPPEPESPDHAWGQKHYFIATIRPDAASRYPTLTPGKSYPMEHTHPTKPTPGLSGWLKRRHDPASWVWVARDDLVVREIERGDAWEGDPLVPLEPPDEPRG